MCLNAALTAGELVSVLDRLQSTHGLCLPNDEDLLFVADGHTVKEINLQTKYVHVIARGFKQAFDVSLSKDSKLGIMDVQAHKAFILEKTEKEILKLKEQLVLELRAFMMGRRVMLSSLNQLTCALISIPLLFAALVATLMVALNYIAK